MTLRSLQGNNTAGNASNFDARINHSCTLVSTTGGILGFSADRFTIDASAFANSLNGGQRALSAVGNNLNLQFTAAVPEPGTWVLMLAGCAGLAAVRRYCQG